MTLAARDDGAAAVDRILNMVFDLLDRRHVDQRSLVGLARKARTHTEVASRLGQLPSELVMHPLLDEKTVRAYTSLTGIAVLGSHRTFNGRIHIGVVEDDERRVAPKFHRNLLDRPGALLKQDLAHRRGTREGKFANDGVRGQFPAHRRRRSRDHVEDAGGNPRARCEFAERERRERR